MGMRETEGSLRAYFCLAGAFSAIVGFRDFSEISKVADVLPAGWKVAAYTQTATRIVLGILFVIAGFQLKAALRKDVTWIKQLLIASGVATALSAMFVGLTLGSMFGNTWLVGAAIGIAITLYLYRSVVRLSEEALAGKLDSNKVA